MLRFIIFIILFIVLVRVISNLFLPEHKKKNSSTRFFYHTFKNMREQQKDRQYQQQDQNDVSQNSLDNMEEAEYEDVTEESAKSSSKKT